METHSVSPWKIKLIDASASIQLRAFTIHYAVTVDAFHQTISLPEMWLGHSDVDTHSTPLVYDYV
jgi:hypothetical protein